MRRRTVLAQLAVFAVISVVIIAYTTFSLLGVHITNRPFSVSVQLDDAGGIFTGAEVAYRGVAVGRVTAVHLTTSGVTVTLAIEHGEHIPANSIANVYDLSAVGEQYVDLVPTASSSVYLRAGSVIPAQHTTTPPQTATVLYDLERFVDSINPQDVETIGREGAAAFANTGPQLRSLLADSISIVDQLSHTPGATLDLLKNSAVLLSSAAAHASDFNSFATSLDELTATLAGSSATLDQFLRQAAPTTTLINTLITTTAPAIGVLLGNLATLSDIQVTRVPGFSALLVAVPQFGAEAPSLVHDGALVGATNLNLDEAVCPTGIPLSNPLSGVRSPLQQANCNQDILVRGAKNAPQPAAADTAAQADIATYDAASQLTTTAAGSPLVLGSTGGQQELLGGNSWQALLLAVTGG